MAINKLGPASRHKINTMERQHLSIEIDCHILHELLNLVKGFAKGRCIIAVVSEEQLVFLSVIPTKSCGDFSLPS